jgi:hypothetical protein
MLTVVQIVEVIFMRVPRVHSYRVGVVERMGIHRLHVQQKTKAENYQIEFDIEEQTCLHSKSNNIIPEIKQKI